MRFVANSYAFQQCKKCENQLRFDGYREYKGGNFLRHSVVESIIPVLNTYICVYLINTKQSNAHNTYTTDKLKNPKL